MIKYLRGCVSELRQVQWPTRNRAMKISMITMVFVLLSAVFLASLDFILDQLILLGR